MLIVICYSIIKYNICHTTVKFNIASVLLKDILV